MTGRQVPSAVWADHNNQAATEVSDLTTAFMEEAGLAMPDPSEQKLLCVECAKEGNYNPPFQVVLVAGTSLCINHM